MTIAPRTRPRPLLRTGALLLGAAVSLGLAACGADGGMEETTSGGMTEEQTTEQPMTSDGGGMMEEPMSSDGGGMMEQPMSSDGGGMMDDGK